MESVSIYSETRNEYLKQLATWIVPPLVEFFRKEYNDISVREGKRVVMTAFQTWCSEVPKWNQDVIDTRVTDLLDSCRCDYVQELMTAVFIAHTKMLTAIRVNSKHKKVQITLPKLSQFLHRIFVECARAFWKAPFLFSEELPPIDKQKNILQAEAMCTDALSSAVRSLLPIKSILQDYLEEDDDDSSSSEEEEEVVPPPKKKSKKSKKVVEVESDSDSSESESELEPEPKLVPLPVVGSPVVVPILPVASIGGAIGTADITEIEEIGEIEPPSPSVGSIASPVSNMEIDLSVVAVSKAEPAAVVEELPAIPKMDPPFVSVAAVTPLPAILAPPTPVSVEPLVETTGIATVIPSDATDAPPSPVKEFQSVPRKVELFKDDAVPNSAAATELSFDTEPSVRFSNYETVFDETTPNVSEIRYAPKMSIEEMDDYDSDAMWPLPKIQIGEETSLSGADIEDFTSSARPSKSNDDLLMSGEFEEL